MGLPYEPELEPRRVCPRTGDETLLYNARRFWNKSSIRSSVREIGWQRRLWSSSMVPPAAPLRRRAAGRSPVVRLAGPDSASLCLSALSPYTRAGSWRPFRRYLVGPCRAPRQRRVQVAGPAERARSTSCSHLPGYVVTLRTPRDTVASGRLGTRAQGAQHDTPSCSRVAPQEHCIAPA